MITKCQVLEFFFRLWDKPEEYFTTRENIYRMISDVNLEEMRNGRNDWNVICQYMSMLRCLPGTMPPRDLCYLKSCFMTAPDTAKEHLSRLINLNLFPQVDHSRAEKVSESTKPEKKPKTKRVPGSSRKKIPNALRQAVWHDFAKDSEVCFCCKREKISNANFECGHIVSVRDGGLDTIQNLRPICSQCNRSMGTKNMLEFMAQCGFCS